MYYLQKVRDDLNRVFKHSNVACYFHAQEYHVLDDELYFEIEGRYKHEIYDYIRDFADFVEVKISSNGIANFTIKYKLY